MVECKWCGAVMGHFDGQGVSHGICKPCLKKESPGAYYMSRRRELTTKLESFDQFPGARDLNGYFWSRRAA